MPPGRNPVAGRRVLACASATLPVIVQRPWLAGSSDGAGVPCSAASPAVTRKASTDRRCCRQVATTVSSRSANRPTSDLNGLRPLSARLCDVPTPLNALKSGGNRIFLAIAKMTQSGSFAQISSLFWSSL